ncbi:rRNA-processing protein EBP2 [Carex littledalei]|uniref:rRNA-processing protein EBP2 n=1 Tax=Carex littledalei TaxID=544730 RepID=A0A833V7M0_9POAL|nr:rRNA-processing protein EBP2 [Carex littledalei]
MVKEIENQERESESESEGTEEKLSTEPLKNAIYNSEALLEKIKDIAWPKKIDWIHKLTIHHQPMEKIDVNDDLAHELAFYTQALERRHLSLTLQRIAFSEEQGSPAADHQGP